VELEDKVGERLNVGHAVGVGDAQAVEVELRQSVALEEYVEEELWQRLTVKLVDCVTETVDVALMVGEVELHREGDPE
jgi:hypothetical protein